MERRMKPELFEELLESVLQMKEIHRGPGPRPVTPSRTSSGTGHPMPGDPPA